LHARAGEMRQPPVTSDDTEGRRGNVGVGELGCLVVGAAARHSTGESENAGVAKPTVKTRRRKERCSEEGLGFRRRGRCNKDAKKKRGVR